MGSSWIFYMVEIVILAVLFDHDDEQQAAANAVIAIAICLTYIAYGWSPMLLIPTVAATIAGNLLAGITHVISNFIKSHI